MSTVIEHFVSLSGLNLYYQKSNQHNDFQTMVYTICLGFFVRQPREPKAFLRQQRSLCGLSDWRGAAHLMFSCWRIRDLARWAEKHQVLPRNKQCFSVSWWSWLVEITRGRLEGSSRNCGRRWGCWMVNLWTIGRSCGLLTRKFDHNLIMLRLEFDRAGHFKRMWTRSPSWLMHSGSLQRPWGLSLFQCLVSLSVL